MPSATSFYGGFSQRKSPWSSNEERLVDEALAAQTVPGEVLAMIRPPLPMVDPWRPREGYGASWERQPTIEAVLATDRWYADRRLDFSGSAGGYSATSRPAMGANPY